MPELAEAIFAEPGTSRAELSRRYEAEIARLDIAMSELHARIDGIRGRLDPLRDRDLVRFIEGAVIELDLLKARRDDVHLSQRTLIGTEEALLSIAMPRKTPDKG